MNRPAGPPRRLTRSARRALVARYTRLQEVPGLPGLRLHLADELEPVWHATQDALGATDAAIPFWAFAWPGGLALARYLEAHPDVVRGRSVLDFGTGSGLVAIVAARIGADSVVAADTDAYAETATSLNARANGLRLRFEREDLLAAPPPAVDVVLVADVWYDGALAERLVPWLRRAVTAGARVLVGDPGRRHLPVEELVELATYEIAAPTRLEDRPIVIGRVFDLRNTG